MKKFDSRIFLASVKREVHENPGTGLSWSALRELLKRNDADFIHQAYRILLGRPVDPSGLEAYLPTVKNIPGRLLLLISLYLSPERAVLPDWLRKTLSAARKLLAK